MNKDFQHKIDFFECSKESNYIPLLAWVLECAQDDYKDVYPILSEYSRFMLWKLMGIPMQDDTKVVLVHHTTNTGSMDLVMEAECETNGGKEKYIAAIEFRKYLSDRLSNTVVENMQKSIVGVDNEQYTRRELNILCVDSQSVTYKECINALRLSAPNINVYTMSELIAPWMQGKPSEKEAFNELVLDVYSPFASDKMQEDVYYVPYNEIQPTPLPCYGSMDVDSPDIDKKSPSYSHVLTPEGLAHQEDIINSVLTSVKLSADLIGKKIHEWQTAGWFSKDVPVVHCVRYVASITGKKIDEHNARGGYRKASK